MKINKTRKWAENEEKKSRHRALWYVRLPATDTTNNDNNKLKITCKQAHIRYQWWRANSLFMRRWLCADAFLRILCTTALHREIFIVRKTTMYFLPTICRECKAANLVNGDRTGNTIKFDYKFMFAMASPPQRNKSRKKCPGMIFVLNLNAARATLSPTRRSE